VTSVADRAMASHHTPTVRPIRLTFDYPVTGHLAIDSRTSGTPAEPP
jgi:hypothetical protein